MEVMHVHLVSSHRGPVVAVCPVAGAPAGARLQAAPPRDQAVALSQAGACTGGVPYVWKLSTVLTPHAWPFARSASVQTTGSNCGSKTK
jgi:hypothetical protein